MKRNLFLKKKHFIIIACVILIPLFLLIFCFSAFKMYYQDAEYPMFNVQKQMRENKYDTVILGDSRAKAGIIPDLLCENSVNMALGGTTPIEMYYTLKEIIENGNTPETVIISFAPQHYYRNDCFWTRSVYFHLLDYSEIKQVIAKASWVSSPLYYSGCEEDTVEYMLYSPTKYSASLLASIGENRIAKNTDTEKKLYENKGYKIYGKADGCSEINFEATETGFYADELNVYYLEKLFYLCIGNDIETYLIQTPVNISSYIAMNYEYITQYESFIAELSEKFPDIYFEKRISYMPDMYFGDNSHLNYNGAVKFTENVKNLINENQHG